MSDPVLLGSRRLARGRAIVVARDYLLAGPGRWMVREVVRHPGSVVVVPWDGEAVTLVEQYRHPAGRRVLEVPAGKLDVPGEAPEDAARRECIEEVGLDPGRLTPLHDCLASPGYTDEFSHLYLAEDLAPVAPDPQGVEEEQAATVRLTAPEVAAGLASGRFDDAKTIICLTALLERLR
ncbi:MAG: NUDIX hydrolase [Actinobacteria bacterium]|nr:NUDIX hydrolase [Actinomycetota bacterium]